MIKKLSHATIYVTNQDEAYKFYTEKLGFEVRTDATMEGGFRWLTVGPKDQPEMEIILMEPKGGMMFDEETANLVRSLIAKGALGTGVFETDDCQQTYEELSSRGVEFLSPPTDRFYGIEALFNADFHGRKLINIFSPQTPHGYWKITGRFCNQGIF